MKKTISLAVVAFFAFSVAVAVAQEAGTPSTVTPATAERVPQEERIVIETRDRNTPAMRGLRVERPVLRRLPNNFGPLVNNEQRDEVYRIQAEYHELLTLLEMRVELLRRERDAKIEGVLTPAQLERFRQARPTPIRDALGR